MMAAPGMWPAPEVFLSSKSIQRTLGTRRAAGYLRNRGVSLSLALRVLCGVMS